jgi:trypsin
MFSYIDMKLGTSENTRDYTLLKVAGWGATKRGGDISTVLLEANVPVIPHHLCQEIYTKLASSAFCAGYLFGGADTCQGDSGGPIFTGYGDRIMLVGVTSAGSGCGEMKGPGVYTKISAANIRKFIEANMADV